MQQPIPEAKMTQSLSLSRRGFLKAAGAVTAGLIVPLAYAAEATTPAGLVEITDWVRIDASGKTVIGLSQCEVGQGVYTGLPQVLADELDAKWSDVSVEFVTGRDAYRMSAAYEPPQQFVGASMSMTMLFQRLRTAGAQARDALTQAGAARLGVRATQCHTSEGRVIHSATGRSVSYGEVAADAAHLRLDPNPHLKSNNQRTFIGQNMKRLDTPMKVNGSAVFGIDVQVPGMLVGAARMAPAYTGKILSVRNQAQILARPGVHAVVIGTTWPKPVPNTVIVVADSYWIAKQAVDAVELEIDPGPGIHVDSKKIHEQRMAAMDDDKAIVASRIGNTRAIFDANPGKMIEAHYHTPYIVHASMEPVVATVHVRDNDIEVWGPIQGQDMVRETLGRAYKMAPEKVIVHTNFLGGSFGRKYVPDFVLHAAQASKAVGRPVKVIRSREGDIQHGFYRPGVSARMRAVLGKDGYPTALHARVVGQSLYGMIKQDKMAAAGGWDETMVEAIYDLAYGVPNLTVDAIDIKQPIPVSFMRSVGSTSSVFFLESFINELADQAGIDAYRYRRKLLAHDKLALAVLDKTAVAAGWDKPLPKNRHRGFAFNLYTGRGGAFETYVAMAVEIESGKNGIKVKRVVCGVDAGTAINPGLIKANIEGGIGFALTNTFKSEITFAEGAAVQSNFHDYPLLTLAEMPHIDVVIVNSDRPPQGCGEVALAPVAPAVASAIFKASKRRLRSMPLKLDQA
ncbi:molybdopterin-dependent oxidoreductase [Herbaspirillum rhizosphaerae]|uniref:Molybdopterin-dependent oxidoreductase n=1 Tax=Herbaspirillum rhizosphaerae TaxID=346179 RepID=A0ABW8Z6Y9_9BURK